MPGLRNRNRFQGTADVGNPEQSTDRDSRRRDTSTMLANMSQRTETQGTKAIVGGFELLLEFLATKLFGFGQLVKPTFHVGMAFVHTEATLDDFWNATSRGQERI